MRLWSLFRSKGRNARLQRAVALLAEADAHRDRRAWREAIDGYRAVLAVRPDLGIVVQLGHCLKEDGWFDEALTLYRHVEAQRPWDDDLQFQIADAETRRGNREAAARHFRAAFALNRSNETARRELESGAEPAGHDVADPPPAALPPILTFTTRPRPPHSSPFEREVRRIAEQLSTSSP